MTRSIPILDGPDPDLLGQRQREIAGRKTLAQAAWLGIEECPRSNSERGLFTRVQQMPGRFAGFRPNAGAYSPTSIAPLDAVRALNEPLIEVHLSNIYQRETFRQHANVSLAAKGIIFGFGSQGCLMALGALVAMLDDAH